MRSGLHTGEVELAGEHVRGVAVHIGARVAAMAGPREVLVSSTVKDLVVGSGIAFEDRGPGRALTEGHPRHVGGDTSPCPSDVMIWQWQQPKDCPEQDAVCILSHQ